MDCFPIRLPRCSQYTAPWRALNPPCIIIGCTVKAVEADCMCLNKTKTKQQRRRIQTSERVVSIRMCHMRQSVTPASECATRMYQNVVPMPECVICASMCHTHAQNAPPTRMFQPHQNVPPAPKCVSHTRMCQPHHNVPPAPECVAICGRYQAITRDNNRRSNSYARCRTFAAILFRPAKRILYPIENRSCR